MLTPTAGLILEPDTSPYTGTTLAAEAKVIDGDYANAISSYWNTHEAYGVDLGEAKEVSSLFVNIRVTAGYESTSYYGSSYDSFKVLKSGDNATWTLVESFDAPSLTVIGTSNVKITFALATNQTARYFKIVAIENIALSGGASAMATEMRAAGPVAIADCILSGSGTLISSVNITVDAEFASTGTLVCSLVGLFNFVTDCVLAGNSSMSATPYLSIPGVQLSGTSGINAGLFLSMPDLALSIAGDMDGSARTFEIDTTNLAIHFFCILTGAADGETDLTLPISSFNSRMRQGDPTYLQVVTPGLEYSSEIADRSNGQIVVRMGMDNNGEILQIEEIIRVNLEDIRIDEGGKNKSITLVGHLTETYATAEYDLEGVSYRRIANGVITVRCTPHKYLRPGCTAVYDGSNFTVNNLTWTMNTLQRIMEVSE